MPDGGTIIVKAINGAPENPGAPFVSISVVDSGIGMTPDVQARIFEPFYTTKEIGRGSGLGLAQVHGFAQQSGGRVEVRSRPGAGTTMTLILPASERSDRSVAKPAATARAEHAAPEAGDALLVEDNDEVAALTREMLEHLGWRVTRVASAEAALGALADQRRIDLVFSDVMMPGGMSGLDLAREARRRRPAIPIVLTSGYAGPIKREAEQAGLPLLPKPFTLDSLAAVLGVAVSK
jgi:CheY-like chemotaxis protein